MANQTLKTVRDKVLAHLGDAANVIWTEAEIDAYTKRGYDELARVTLAIWDFDYLNDVAARATYTLPATLIQVDRVTWNLRRIEPQPARRLRAQDTTFQTSQGQPNRYSMQEDGIDKIRLIPVPSATATADQAVNNTTIEGYWRGSALTVDADEFDIPERYIKNIRFFDLWKALEREGEGQDLKLADHYKQRYAVGLKRMIKRRENISRERVGRMGGVLTRFRDPLVGPRLPLAFGRPVRWR